MEQIQEMLGITAGVLALVGYIPYIISILRGKTRPNRATWLIWTVIGGLLAFSYIAEGDFHTIWLPLGYFLGPFITVLLSIRYGYAIWTRLDTFCIIAAAVSIIPWLLSHDAIMTLLINVAIDSTGAIPTLVKTFKEPDTEDFTAWTIFFIANTIEVIAVSNWNLAIVYPLYLFLLAGTMVAFILRGKLKRKMASIEIKE
ncbi:MAG: hypothetical protein A3F14_01780 [Gammaproteobacteria bacterium RIFCSPHIGHO2_12_FULL_43_28]|nr:MAG: hypothetical protein A3F14_01780 [Gammaproteobacteria bacterium RIFCSPHIGHO2_12_FULL_43_28]